MRYACGLLLWTSILQAGENWPGWRGPTGMGISDEKSLPVVWGGKEKKNILWKAPLFPSDKVRRDQNQSSPIVWSDRVFVTVSYWPEGTSEKEFPEHHVLCFAAGDGKKLWDVLVPPGPWKLTDLRGGYTAPTPATDGKQVYVLFGSSVLAAISLDGKLAWHEPIAPHFFDVAIGTSPVLYQGTVLVACDQLKDKKSSCLLAFNTADGKLKWKKDRAVDWAHSTPILVTSAGKPQLLLATANGPQGVDPGNGEILWWFQSPKRIGDTVSPVFRAGLVYVDSGRGGPAVCVEAGTGDVSKTGVKWSINSMPEGFSSPVLVGDHLYRLHAPGMISCLTWADGKEVYKERLQGVDVALSPIVTPDGKIYCAGAGKSFVIQAGPNFTLLAENDLGDPSRASPAVAKGRIYLKGGKNLFCIGN